MLVGVGRPERVGARSYRSALREQQARWTRRRIVAAATEQFRAHGYAGTTMRAIAASAGVSLPTVEALFGTKPGLLKAAIDVAIAGDDAPVPVLDRDWAVRATEVTEVDQLLDLVVAVLTAAQERSAGLVAAVLDPGAPAELAELRDQLVGQRERTAAWVVDRLATLTSLRPELARRDAVETVWLLMDPAVFLRLIRHRGWDPPRYRAWVTRSLQHLLLPDTDGPTRAGTTRRKR
jgi:AcrR family transcriptional regulator